MNHPNITNGASLEDCYTNIFALADLCGIKWRRLTTVENYLPNSSDPLDDPVLNSYSKCLAAELLCVWRRATNKQGSSNLGPVDPVGVRTGNSDLHPSNQPVVSHKELWIFWYGEGPDFSRLTPAELREVEQGSWENGLSYECRILLFKALHNLIEKCLLSRGFARFGRWFVQPLDNNTNEKDLPYLGVSSKDSSTQLTFAFNFFVHGESTVCATVDVRQRTPVYRLTRSNLLAAQGSQCGLNVILSPYGISGVINGQSYKDNDPSVQRLLSEWRRFYPLYQSSKDGHQSRSQVPMHVTPHFHVDCLKDVSVGVINDGNSSSNAFPSIVEVIVAGLKMKYPSSYVYLVPEFKSETGGGSTRNCVKGSSNLFQSANQIANILTPPNTPPDYLLKDNLNESRIKTPILSPRQPDISSSHYRIRTNAFQEINVNTVQLKPIDSNVSATNSTNVSSSVAGSSAPANTSPDNEDVIAALARWDFSDPCGKMHCICFRCKAKKTNNQSVTSKSNTVSSSLPGSTNKKVDKNEKEKQNQKGGVTKILNPFHRRSLVQEDLDLGINSSKNVNNNSISVNNCSSLSSNSSSSSSSSCSSSSSSCSNLPTSSIQPKTPSFPYKSPIGVNGLPSLQSNATTPGGTAIDSPRSVAPLVNNEAPPSTGTVVANNSILSPHSGKEINNPPDANQIALSSTENKSNKSHLDQTSSSFANAFVKGNDNTNTDLPCVANNQWNSGQSSNEVEASTTNNTNSIKQRNASGIPAKRPMPPFDFYGNDCFSKKLLYDFDSVDISSSTWDLPQPKNRRIIRGIQTDNLFGTTICENMDYLNCLKSKDPYEFSEFEDDSASKNVSSDVNKQENNENIAPSEIISNNFHSLPLQSAHHLPINVSKDSSKSNINIVDGVSVSSPHTPRVFTREEELRVSYNDLNRIFNSSDEDSNLDYPDKNLSTNIRSLGTTNSNGGTNSCVIEDMSKINGRSSGFVELTRIFPTPPSMEHTTASSPCNTFGGTDMTLIDDVTVREKSDVYPNSPTSLENAKDLSYVYKPPAQHKFIISPKYAPLNTVPSLPTVQLPSECIYKSSDPQVSLQSKVQVKRENVNILSKSTGYSHQSNQIMQPPQSHPMMMPHVHPHQVSRMPHSFSPNSQPSPIGPNMRMMRSAGPMRANYVNQQYSGQNSPGMYVGSYSNTFVSDRSMSATYQMINSNTSQASGPGIYHAYQGANSPMLSHHSPVSAVGNTGALTPLQYDVSHQPLIGPRMQDPNQSGFSDTHGLIKNLVLSDSMLNLFKDHNFESCTLCVCNMSIKGSDVGIYLPDTLAPTASDESEYKCTCGFSAVANRHRSSFSGLFYEDEVDITGVVYDPVEGLEKKVLCDMGIKNEQESKDDTNIDQLDATIVDLIRTLCSTLLPSGSSLIKSIYFENIRRKALKGENADDLPVLLNSVKVVSKNVFLLRPNALQRSDGCEVAFHALMNGKQILNGFSSKMMLQQFSPDKMNLKASCLHEWIFENGSVSANNSEVVRFLKCLQPLLQESVQKKRQGIWEVTYSVSGPLTWRQFHRLTGKGHEDQCEPQPIPSLLVGRDKDWLALSPFAIKYWQDLLLEPYSVTRDIAYIVISPDDNFVLSRVKTYFKELSSTYEMNKLGRHLPITKVMRDGIMRVGKNIAKNIANEPIDEWFNKIGDGVIASKIKLFAGACRYYVAPHLSAQTLDKSLFDSCGKSNDGISVTNNKSTPSPMNSELNDSKGSNEDDSANQSASAFSSFQQNDQDDDPNKQPVIVIYIVEPFNFANLDSETYRLSCLGLLRCYVQMLNFLPEHFQRNINLQLVSLDSIVSAGEDFNGSKRQSQMKALAFAVFNQCRKVLVHHPVSKSLTGFGPAASLDNFLKSKEPGLGCSRIYTPTFILAPLKDKQTELGEMFGDRREKSQTLYCAYCLTEDQKWLIVACSNDKGDLLETTVINIAVPNRTKRKKASVIKFGLHKIFDFIFSVMAETVQPWRLIIGRLGRVGHGELCEWASLLSKRSLLRYSKLLKEKCGQCSMMASLETPCILSACLISLEADTALRVFPDQFMLDDRFNNSNTCHLSTPEEASCTHILVFPTSTTTQSSQGTYPIDQLGPTLGEDDDLLQALGAEAGADDLVEDIFTEWGESPESPRNHGLNHPDSPSCRQSGFDVNGSMKGSNGIGADFQDEQLQLLQQPLALGYYVSTAPTGPLPRWFWSSSPHLQDLNPTFLKSALLIHTPSVQQNDDLYHNTPNFHPLDSNLTTVVLRYVLEGYNSLSWISLDPSTHDRASCLPIHIQILMQIYHTLQALV